MSDFCDIIDFLFDFVEYLVSILKKMTTFVP